MATCYPLAGGTGKGGRLCSLLKEWLSKGAQGGSSVLPRHLRHHVQTEGALVTERKVPPITEDSAPDQSQVPLTDWVSLDKLCSLELPLPPSMSHRENSSERMPFKASPHTQGLWGVRALLSATVLFPLCRKGNTEDHRAPWPVRPQTRLAFLGTLHCLAPWHVSLSPI